SRDRRPFCLVVSMTHPHDPYTIPEEWWNRYRDEEIDPPRVEDLAASEDPHSRRLRHVIGLGTAAAPSVAQIRAARRAYYGAVSYVNDQIGSLVSTLGQARLDRNTIILLLADHGDLLGERGLWYKMSFFEAACRIPLIVHAPGRFAPRRITAPASLLDVLPTLAEIAGGGSPPAFAAPVQGKSLLPALKGAEGPGEVFGEYLADGAIARVVRTGRGRQKFVHSPGDPDQLYDVAEDPDERRTLAQEAGRSERVRDFRAEVARRWNLQAVHEAV